MSKSWAANLERQSFDFCFNIKQCLNTKNAFISPLYEGEYTLFLLCFFFSQYNWAHHTGIFFKEHGYTVKNAGKYFLLL